MSKTIIKAAWKTARDTNPNDPRFARPAPMVVGRSARKSKQLRAEPIAAEFEDDRLRLGAHLPELCHEWLTWRPTDRESPGRIDASVFLAYELLPVRNEPAVVAEHPAMAVPDDPFAQRFGTLFASPGSRGAGGSPRPIGG